MDVEQILNERKVDFQSKGQDFVVRCLNPEHEDNHPSMHVDKISGTYNCFSCGFKGNIFKYFNVHRDWQDFRVKKLQKEILKIRQEANGLPMPPGFVPFNRDFRGVRKDILRKFNAFTHKDHEDRIIFPIPDITGKIRAFIGRYINSNAHPKYMIFPRGVDLPLFPSKTKPIDGSIILVEGSLDALNLISGGLTNAVAVLGANNIDRSKLESLKFLGVRKIYIMFDADDAGRKASRKAEEELDNIFLIEQIELPEGLDPGDLSMTDIKQIKESLYDESSNS
jgi:DNA primase